MSLPVGHPPRPRVQTAVVGVFPGGRRKVQSARVIPFCVGVRAHTASGDEPPSGTARPRGTSDRSAGRPPAPVLRGLPPPLRLDVHGADPSGRADGVRFGSGFAQGPVRGRSPEHDRPRPAGRPGPGARRAIAPPAGGRGAPSPPQADAAAVPRRADARLRVGDGGGRRAGGHFVASGAAIRASAEHAGDHPGGDPAGGVRRRGRRAARTPAHAPGRDPGDHALAAGHRDDRRPPAALAGATAAPARCSRRPTRSCTRRSPTGAGTPTSATRDDILSLLVGARFEDGSAMSDARASGPADDPADRRSRDHRDRACLGVRPAVSPPGALRAPAR